MTVTAPLDGHVAELRDQGFTIVHGGLTPHEVATAKATLAAAVDEERAIGRLHHVADLDPNDRNLRVGNLLGQAPIWERLADHPNGRALVAEVLDDDVCLLSSFSANIVLPGSQSMGLHCDDMTVVPEPWLVPRSANIFFYLDEVDEENGATRYLPDSHHRTTKDEARRDDMACTLPLEAPAGSMVAMDGRLWHTSGTNTSADRTRDVILSFYIADFVRPQMAWHAMLSDDMKAGLSPPVRQLLGLDTGNLRLQARDEAFTRTKPARGA